MIKKVLLHVCCAPCSASVIERLKADGYEVGLFWCNPNIFPLIEEEARRKEAKLWAEKNGLEYYEDDMTHGEWLESVKGLEKEPEGGARCTVCFILRLKKTAERAKKEGYDFFATTLTNSRYKNAELINTLGVEIGEAQGVKFLAVDWKKDGGEMRTVELAKEAGMYRQGYCGCEFSRR